MITKEQCEEYIEHKIRTDTYLFIKRMLNGEKYIDIYNDLDINREKYNIKEDICLTKEKTCKDYIEIIINKNEEDFDYDISFLCSKKEESDWQKKSGIYYIAIDGKIVYVGKTTNFKNRFQSHKNNYKTEDKHIYHLMREAKEINSEITMGPLIILDDIELKNKNQKFTKRDLSSMELALITYLQPIGNIEGRLQPYCYN